MNHMENDLYQNSFYMDDVMYVTQQDIPWQKLNNKTVMVTGASGMIGSFLIDVLMSKNESSGLACTVYALGRDISRLKKRFSRYSDNPFLHFRYYEAAKPFVCEDLGKIDYLLHLASNTHPLQYATDPIGTITTNVLGLQTMLEFAVQHHAERFAFASSNEVYGENRGDVELFDEEYCGYINSNTMRAGYPESKRCGEALCQAYRVQKHLDCVIPRLTRTYGPTMKKTDTKAISQFILRGLENEKLVLKSSGNQYYSFLYVADSVSGLLTILLKGASGEAYNIADQKSDITLKELAVLIAKKTNTSVVYEIPDQLEASGYSKATKARLDGHKLAALGWKPRYDISGGLDKTLAILRKVYGKENE